MMVLYFGYFIFPLEEVNTATMVKGNASRKREREREMMKLSRVTRWARWLLKEGEMRLFTNSLK